MMGVLFAVGCGVVSIGLIIGIVVVVLQYFQIKKLRARVQELKSEVAVLEKEENNEKKESVKSRLEKINAKEEAESCVKSAEMSKEKSKETNKRVTFKDLSSDSSRHSAGADSSCLESELSHLKAFTKFLNEYSSQLATSLPVSTPLPAGAIFNHFSTNPPKEGINFSEALKKFNEDSLSKATHWLHPHYLGPPGPGRTTADVLAHFIYPLVDEEDHNEEDLSWLRTSFEVPEFEQEFAVESATEAHFHMFLAARDKKNDEHEEDIDGKMVVYSSNEANMHVAKAARLAMMRHHKWVGEQPIADLERRIEKDINACLIPTVIIVTLGSYGLMTLELDSKRVAELAELAEKYGCWLHVDASLIGGYWLGERAKKWKPSFEDVDSLYLEIFPHSESTKIIWTKHENYWNTPLTNLTAATSFRLFVTFSLLGSKKLGKILDSHFQLSFELEDRLKRCSNIKIYSAHYSSNFFSFSFQYHSADLGPCQITDYTKRLFNFLQSSRKFIFGSRDVRGTTIIVATVLGYLHEVRDIEEVWTELGPLIEEFEKKKDQIRPLTVSTFSTPTQPFSELSTLSFDLTSS